MGGRLSPAAVTARKDSRHPEWSPRDNAVDEVTLLGRRSAKVDARRLDGFVSHQIRKERDVVELREKVLGEAVPERVRVDHLRVDAVLLGKHLQLIADTSCRDSFPETVAKEVAA